MRAKSVILLMVALGCGLVASAGISKVVLDQKSAKKVETVDILVAVKVIEAATKLTPENVKLEAWPKDRLPVGTLSDLKEVDGKFAKQPLYEGEPILLKKLMLTNESAAQTIPEGFKIFDLQVDDNMGYIKPGDRVDIFGYFDKKSGRVAESKSVLVMQNVSVHMVDGISTRSPDDVGNKATKTFQLLIRDSQYEALNMATHLCEGKLRLALRPLGTSDDDVTDNGEEFLGWIRASDEKKDAAPAFNPLDAMALGMGGDEKPSYERKITVLTPNGLQVYALPSDGGLPTLIEGEEKSYGPSQTPGAVSKGAKAPGARSSDRPGGFDPQYPSSPTEEAEEGATDEVSETSSSKEDL
jgi:pilus assembly protein CpaB